MTAGADAIRRPAQGLPAAPLRRAVPLASAVLELGVRRLLNSRNLILALTAMAH
jgi:hypothetical protein